MPRSVLLSRKTINTRSGAGQMIVSQARFLRERGYDVSLCCAKFGRGATGELRGIRRWSIPRPLNALLPSGPRERIYESRVIHMRGDGLLIDHGESIAAADIAYVHNYLAPEFAARMPDYFQNERLPWRGADVRTTLIANSRLVRRALIDTLALPGDRIFVNYPGYDETRFNLATKEATRETARRELGVGADEILVGLITSGDFRKRGLDRFVESFATLNARYAQLRGLVLGGRSTPAELASDANYRSGRIIHRPVTDAPERITAALDLVLYPARYEEFGIVVLEAMAMGIPVVTSTAVGAAELMRKVAAELVIDAARDTIEAYCARAIDVLDADTSARRRLGTALSGLTQDYSQGNHNARLAALIDSTAT